MTGPVLHLDPTCKKPSSGPIVLVSEEVMIIARAVLRSVCWGDAALVCRRPLATRFLSTADAAGGRGVDKQNPNAFESAEEFERRIFDDFSGSGSQQDSYLKSLGRVEKDGSGLKSFGGDKLSHFGGLDERFSTLSDDMDGKLEKAARYFEYDSEEVFDENYSYRPDMNLEPNMTYEPKDLDLRRPAVERRKQIKGFEVTTEQVLRKADFRMVEFLSHFLTKSGIIIKRSQTKISAKAQRRVAREIKTARAFGLMPFTTMGTKQFIYGKTMENLNQDYEHAIFEERGVGDMED